MFKIKHRDENARAGLLKTKSGAIDTPFFMPVATFASGRGIGPKDYEEQDVQCVISNAFLLSLKPGIGIIKEIGGLHKFSDFKGCFFTDSGGFQSSRKDIHVRTTKNGVHLKSPYDGKTIVMTPKKLVDIQTALDSDVAMVIDDMAPPDASEEEFETALKNTHRWAEECKRLHDESQKYHDERERQLLFGIVQGGYDAEMRKKSAEYLTALDFDGYAIGGCAIGEPKEDMYRAIRNSTPYLPQDKPRYLMGVGSPPDIVMAVGLGVDCFDSIFPTRNARHNMIFTRKGPYQLEKARFSQDPRPLEEGCNCWVCKKHSRAYIRHLSSIHEGEGMRLRQIHNVHFMMKLMKDIRESIRKERFEEFKKDFIEGWFKGRVPSIYQGRSTTTKR